MPNRHESSDKYRYGFQGQEKDDEIKGEGNSINYKFRMHDPRVGRFFAVDPLTKEYPHYTPYSFSGNKVINSVEREGLEEQIVITSFFQDKIYEVVLKKSHYTYTEWKARQRGFWTDIVLNPESEDRFVGYYSYLKDPSNNSSRLNLKTNQWNGNDKGTLYIANVHGDMAYGFDKTDAGVGDHKISTELTKKTSKALGNASNGLVTLTAGTGGAASPVTVPALGIINILKKGFDFETMTIEFMNGDNGSGIEAGIGLATKWGVGKLFTQWDKKQADYKEYSGQKANRRVLEMFSKMLLKKLREHNINIPDANKPKPVEKIDKSKT